MKKSASGFTLIESLIYFAILGILVLALGATLVQTLSSKAQSQVFVEIGDSARTVMERMSSEIRAASSVTTPAVGASAGTLTLVMADTAKNPTTFSLSSGTVMMRLASGTAVALHGDEIRVTALSFSNVAYSGAPGSIRITMTVASPAGTVREYAHQETFYTTATVRKK